MSHKNFSQKACSSSVWKLRNSCFEVYCLILFLAAITMSQVLARFAPLRRKNIIHWTHYLFTIQAFRATTVSTSLYLANVTVSVWWSLILALYNFHVAWISHGNTFPVNAITCVIDFVLNLQEPLVCDTEIEHVTRTSNI